eukprot:scaffold379_cov71-Cyclotella_meneghiniana.AAC.8
MSSLHCQVAGRKNRPCSLLNFTKAILTGQKSVDERVLGHQRSSTCIWRPISDCAHSLSMDMPPVILGAK